MVKTLRALTLVVIMALANTVARAEGPAGPGGPAGPVGPPIGGPPIPAIPGGPATPGPAGPGPEAHVKREPGGKVTLNFADVEISSIIKLFSEITGKNFIYDETLKGRITIIAPSPLTKDEALSLFVSALEIKNFTVLPAGAAYKIVPSSIAKQSGMKVFKDSTEASADEFMVRLIPLNHISTQETLPVIQPLVSRYGQVSAFGSRNALLVVDTAVNMNKILELISSLDTAAEVVEPEIIYLRHAQAETLVQTLKKEAQRLAAGGGGKPGEQGAADAAVTHDSRLNAIILSGAKKDRAFLRDFIAALDVAPPEASSRINVHYLENADAESLGKVLESLTKAAPGAPGQPSQPVSQELTGKITITPDKGTNSLIIMASPVDYQNLVQVIKKLDRRPKQVFVEAMITEVTIDKALELGSQWRMTGEVDGNPVAIGGFGTVDSSAISSVLSGLAGFSVGGLGNFLTIPVTGSDGSTYDLTAPGFAALFSMSQFKDVINVLSTPHILTSDNKEAEIMVGENVPFLSSFTSSTDTSSATVVQSIERQDIGIRLKIKPKISEGDFVKLDIYQEISSIAPTTVEGASDIITTKRSATTTVVVKNNQTVVIGGLIQNKTSNSVTKVPILGDIPILGWLFKYKDDENQKTNLLVFITPNIIEDFRGLDELKGRKEREFIDQSRTEPVEDKPEDKAGAEKGLEEKAADGD
jgi:general secretion pathway protein D